MKKPKGGEGPSSELRKRAEASLADKRGKGIGEGDDPTADPERLVQELRVHQIELEMQNEELQRARSAAEEALARYTELYEFAPVGYLTLDRGGIIQKLNLTAAQMLGRERSRLVGLPLRNQISQESRAAFDTLLQSVFVRQGREACTVVVRRAGADPLFLELTATRSEAGDECRLAATDTTERVRAVEEREAAQAKLAQSDRLNSMGILAAGVAHEINNPLSYVLYNIESLAEDLPALAEELRHSPGAGVAAPAVGAKQGSLPLSMYDDVLERLSSAISGTRRIRDIASALGSFARADRTAGMPVNVLHSIEQALQLAHNEIQFRARVVKDFAPVPDVLAADSRLVQVFLNLLIHAAHSIDEGRAEENEITVRTWTEGDQVFIEVSDTGKGIAPEDQGKMFEPFFTSKDAGAGLGLSICRSIVSSFGGEITVTSQLGKGTRFLVRLPRAPADRQQPVAAEPGRKSKLARGRLLVVDDEPDLLKLASRVLGRAHEVITASSGQEAQALLQTDRRFDVIYCDLMMPKMTGMQLHAWPCETAPELAARVVFMTGGAFTPGASEYLRKVGNLVLDKPIDPVTFKRTTAELIAAARSSRGG